MGLWRPAYSFISKICDAKLQPLSHFLQTSGSSIAECSSTVTMKSQDVSGIERDCLSLHTTSNCFTGRLTMQGHYIGLQF